MPAQPDCGGAHATLGEKTDVLGQLVRGESIATEVEELPGVELGVAASRDERRPDLAPRTIGDTDDGDLGDAREGRGLSGMEGALLGGKLADIGINDQFMKDLGETFKPNTSALFVLVRKATPDKVLEGLKKFKGTVIQTSLTKDKEEELREVLEQS